MCKEAVLSKVFKTIEKDIQNKFNEKLKHRHHLEDKMSLKNSINSMRLDSNEKDDTNSSKQKAYLDASKKIEKYPNKIYPVHEIDWNKKPDSSNIEWVLNPLGSRSGMIVNKKKLTDKLSVKTDLSTLASLNKPFKSEGYYYLPEKIEYTHPGKWCNLIKDGNEYWSCCMSEDEHSKGCIKSVISGGKDINKHT